MKMLIINPNTISKRNWGHQLFRNEIAKQHQVIFYGKRFKGYRGPNLPVSEIIKRYCNGKPDVLLTYDTYMNVGNPGIRSLKGVVKININIDYEANVKQQNNHFKSHKYDLLFAVVNSSVEIMKEYAVCNKIHYLPFSVDTNIYKKSKALKTNDVCAIFTVKDALYPNRGKLHDMLHEMSITSITERITQRNLIKAINESKIIITSNNRFKHLSMRYTETLACGGFLLADKPDDFDRLGFVDDKHLVLYDGLDDLRDKIVYYLNPKNENERERIAKAGMKHVRTNHSCKVRIKEMTDIIKKEFPKRLKGK